MATLTKEILQSAYQRDSSAALLDPSFGGQFGFATNIAGWISNQAYVKQNLIALLLEAPGFFQYMPNPAKWVEILRNLIETRIVTIEGLKAGIKVSTDTHPIGAAGEMQHEPTDSKRDQTEPVLNFGPDIYGNSIQKFIAWWIMYGIMEMETKVPMAISLGKGPFGSWLAPQYSMTCMFIEPDQVFEKPVHAWIVPGMWPMENGAVDGRKDKTSAMPFSEVSIPFTGFSLYGEGVNDVAQAMMKLINYTNANPNLRKSYITGATADIKAAAVGYAKGVDDLANNTVK